LDLHERTSRLVHHLAGLVQRGAMIEDQGATRAVVLRRVRSRITPNVVMGIVGAALFAATRQPLFLLAAVVAGVGWHRKSQTAAVMRRFLVRVDESGRVKECELERA
jgi:hypothetical protein